MCKRAGLPKTTVSRVLKKICVLLATIFSYFMQSGQAILAKQNFAADMLNEIDNDELFLK
jgi:hypothetical protein